LRFEGQVKRISETSSNEPAAPVFGEKFTPGKGFMKMKKIARL
jgi:hypothetical protein